MADNFAKPVEETPPAPAVPKLGDVKLYDKDDKPVFVTPEEAPHKILSGEYGYEAGTRVPVRVNGEVGSVPAENLRMFAEQGATTVSGAQYREAKLQKDYGDFAHQAETYAVNTLDSASLGTTNFLAGAIGGEKVREHLRNINEANPNAAIAGQVTGLVAPIAADVLTGGAATPIVGADIAATIARLGLKGEQAIEAARLLSVGGKALTTAEEVSGAARLGLKAEETGRAAKAILGVEEAALPAIRGAGTDIHAGIEAANLASKAAPALPEAVGLGERALGALKSAPGAVVWGPGRAVAKIGSTVERGLADLIGTEATSFAGKLAQKVVPAVGKGVAEGGLYGAGGALGEQSIQEKPDYFGEKMLHAIGYGALFGGGLGVGGAGLGAVGRKLLGAMGDRFEEGAEKYVVKAIDKDGKFLERAEELPGGVNGLKNTLLSKGLVSAGDRIQDSAPKIKAAREAQEALMPELYAKLDATAEKDAETLQRVRIGPAVSDVEKLVAEVLTESKMSALEKLAHPEAASLEKIRTSAIADLRGMAALEDVAAHVKPGPTVERIERTPEEFQRYIKDHIQDPDVQSFFNSGVVPDSVKFESKVVQPKGVEKTTAVEPRMTFAQMAEYTGKIRTVAEGAKSPHLKDALTELSDALTSKLESDAAAHFLPKDMMNHEADVFVHGFMDSLGHIPAKGEISGDFTRGFGRELLTLHQLRVADEMARASFEKVAAAGEKPSGLGSKILETGVGSHILGKALSGAGMAGLAHVQGAAAAAYMAKLAAGAAKKVVQERGASAAASTLDRLSILGNAVEMAGRYEKKIDSGVSKIFERRGDFGKIGESSSAIPGKTLSEKYDNAVEMVMKAAADSAGADRVREEAQRLAPYSKFVADSFERAALKTTVYLLTEMPKPKAPEGALYPHLDRIEPSDQEKHQWLQKVEVCHNPLAILKQIENGTVSFPVVDALKQTNPAMYEEIGAKIKETASKQKKKASFAVQQSIKTYLGQPIVDSTKLSTLQKTFVGGAQHQEGGGSGPALRHPIKSGGGPASYVGLTGRSPRY